MELTQEQLHNLQHAIGADQYGRIVRGGGRNFFGTDKDSKDGQVCESLVVLGLMWPRGFYELYQEHVYHVTEAGIDAVRKCSPSPPKVSRSKRRYQEWIDNASDSYSFGDWLKMQKNRKHSGV